MGVCWERSVGEVCAEWAEVGEAVEAMIRASGRALTALAIDAWTHEQDLANAAGVRSGRHGSGLALAMNSAWAMKAKIRSAGLPPLRVVTDGADWIIGDGEPGATLRLDPYELARAFMARRSLAQLAAYDWEGDPAPYLALIPFFEPPRYDIVE